MARFSKANMKPLMTKSVDEEGNSVEVPKDVDVLMQLTVPKNGDKPTVMVYHDQSGIKSDSADKTSWSVSKNDRVHQGQISGKNGYPVSETEARLLYPEKVLEERGIEHSTTETADATIHRAAMSANVQFAYGTSSKGTRYAQYGGIVPNGNYKPTQGVDHNGLGVDQLWDIMEKRFNAYQDHRQAMRERDKAVYSVDPEVARAAGLDVPETKKAAKKPAAEGQKKSGRKPAMKGYIARVCETENGHEADIRPDVIGTSKFEHVAAADGKGKGSMALSADAKADDFKRVSTSTEPVILDDRQFSSLLSDPSAVHETANGVKYASVKMADGTDGKPDPMTAVANDYVLDPKPGRNRNDYDFTGVDNLESRFAANEAGFEQVRELVGPTAEAPVETVEPEAQVAEVPEPASSAEFEKEASEVKENAEAKEASAQADAYDKDIPF